MADKKEIDWKSSIVTLVPAILSSGLIITGLSTFFSDIYNKPNLQISVFPIKQGTTSVDVSNDGRVPATNLKLFIRTPENILSYDNFTTENITVSKIDPKLLRVDIPRLVQGGGSMVNMDLTTDTKHSASNQSVIVHATYDQGSLTRVLMSELTFDEKVVLLWTSFFGNPIVSILVGLVTLGAMIFIYRNFRQRKSRYFLERLTHKLNYIIGSGQVHPGHKLQDLSSLQSDATELFSRRRLLESHFNIFREQFHRLVFEIFYITWVGKEITIFGYGFGEVAGVIILAGQKPEIKYWSDTRIDVKYSDIVESESTLVLIKNTGVLKTGKVKEFIFPVYSLFYL